MRVEAEGQGAAFSWDGEPSCSVLVVLTGTETLVRDRAEAVRLTWLSARPASRPAGLRWTDLEWRMRHSTAARDSGAGELAPVALKWLVQFETWEEAAVAFTDLCKAVGMDDDAVPLRIET